MVKMTWLIGTLALCGVGCGDGAGTDEPGSGGPVEEEGRVEIALELADMTVDDAWMAVITATPSGVGTPARIEREINGDFVETIHLKAGSYRIGVEIYAPDDPAPTLSGEQGGIAVIAGALTVVTIPLVPSGGVQVWAHLPDVGLEWTCEGSMPLDGMTPQRAFGTQRIERADNGTWRPVYYLWICGEWTLPCVRLRTDVLEGGAPSFASAPHEPASPSDEVHLRNATAVRAEGSRFVLYSARYAWITSMSSTDGLRWEVEDSLETHNLSYDYNTGVYSWLPIGCGVVTDDRVRLFCGVSSIVDQWTMKAGVVGYVHDELSPSPFPPWDDDDDTPAYDVVPAQTISAGYNGLTVLGALHAGGAFRVWSTLDWWGNGSYEAVFVSKSLDGVTWSQDYFWRPSCLGANARPWGSAWAMYEVEGTLHAYVIDSNDKSLVHLKSVR